MVYFPNTVIELFETVDSEVKKDSYWEPNKDYVFVCECDCDFQAMTPKDTLNEFGEVLEDTYKLYIPLDVEITSSMLVRVKGEPYTYEITGTPIVNNRFGITEHKKVIVQKERKPTMLERDDDG